MKVTINGNSHEVSDGLSLEQCLIELDKVDKGIAVAIDQEIIPRSTWAIHCVNEGDDISIFRAIAGG